MSLLPLLLLRGEEDSDSLDALPSGLVAMAGDEVGSPDSMAGETRGVGEGEGEVEGLNEWKRTVRVAPRTRHKEEGTKRQKEKGNGRKKKREGEAEANVKRQARWESGPGQTRQWL